MKSLSIASIVFAIAGFTGAAQATIVNISGTTSTPTSQFFAAGTYNISVIDNSASSGGYNGWTYATPIAGQAKPYRETYTFTVGSTSTTYDVSTGGPSGYYTSYASTAAALAAFASSPTGYAKITGGVYQGSFSQMQLILASDATVLFSVPDNLFSDNTGGVSLSVNRAVPEPQSIAMVFAGLGALAWTRRRRNAN